MIVQIPKVMVQGLDKVDQLLTLTMAAYNLTRLRTVGAMSGENAEMTSSKCSNERERAA